VINIFSDFFKQRKRSFLKKDKNKHILPQKALKDIKKEFEEHLQAINENTNEIQSNYEYLCEIENKINKLTERIDQIQFFLQSNTNFIIDRIENFEIKPLTRKEQYIFLVLYTLEDEKGIVSYLDITKKTGFTESLVRDYVTSIIEKGVPIIKRYINNRVYLKLDKEFKRLQAKENILKIDTAQKELINF
jgi:predicted transcriptional regulator